jgi:hypothetical protein
MALNFQQVLDKVKQIGLGARSQQQVLDELYIKTHQLLADWSERLEELRLKVERARQADPNLRCALPLKEHLNASFPAPAIDLDDPHNSVTILAADGSQVLPTRHASLNYSLVNVGAISMRSGSGLTPHVSTESSLLFADDLYTPTGDLSVEAIEQQRDIAERVKIRDLAASFPAPLLALTDGPLELWGAKNAGEEDYRRNLEIFRSILSELMEKGVIVAGYVDKPAANLVIRALETTLLSTEEDLSAFRTQHPLRGVIDRKLFGFLPPGARSAVFGLRSISSKHYTGDLALNFFYLNVGYAKHPSLVRVEVPTWVVNDPEKINLLHAALLHQCRMLGVRPYPYILQRAHEMAVVTFEEKEHIERLLELELRHAGIELEDSSNKQSGKDLQTRRK